MKKTIITIVILVVLGAIAYGISIATNDKPQVAIDPCGVDWSSTFLNDVPLTMTEKEVATRILTQYLEALKQVTECPYYNISEYQITMVGEPRPVQGNFMIDVKFDVKPTDLAQNVLDTPETTTDGEWIRAKQATLGVIRAMGNSTTTVSYRLAIEGAPAN